MFLYLSNTLSIDPPESVTVNKFKWSQSVTETVHKVLL